MGVWGGILPHCLPYCLLLLLLLFACVCAASASASADMISGRNIITMSSAVYAHHHYSSGTAPGSRGSRGELIGVTPSSLTLSYHPRSSQAPAPAPAPSLPVASLF